MNDAFETYGSNVPDMRIFASLLIALSVIFAFITIFDKTNSEALAMLSFACYVVGIIMLVGTEIL